MATLQKSNSSSSKKKKWRPAANKEARRLGNTADDWTLDAGDCLLGRTRHSTSREAPADVIVPARRRKCAPAKHRSLFAKDADCADDAVSSIASSLTM